MTVLSIKSEGSAYPIALPSALTFTKRAGSVLASEATASGRFRLLCPFNVTGNLIGTKIGITFLSVIDDDGRETGARVRASFRHAALGSNVAITNGTCDSNTSSFPGPHNLSCPFVAYTIKINESVLVGCVARANQPTRECRIP